MLWILRRGDQSLLLEIRLSAAGLGYELVVIYPEQRVVTEDAREPAELLTRTVEVLKNLRDEGWRAEPPPTDLSPPSLKPAGSTT